MTKVSANLDTELVDDGRLLAEHLNLPRGLTDVIEASLRAYLGEHLPPLKKRRILKELDRRAAERERMGVESRPAPSNGKPSASTDSLFDLFGEVAA